jgi:hypothetical protein
MRAYSSRTLVRLGRAGSALGVALLLLCARNAAAQTTPGIPSMDDEEETTPVTPPPAPPASDQPATEPPPATSAAPSAPPAPEPPPTATAASVEAAPTDGAASLSAVDAATEAEALAIEAELAEGNKTGGADDGYKLDIYGFADVTYTQTVKKTFSAPYNSFALGRLNLYIASELGDNWRTLAEVRFTYLPHGATAFTETGSTRTDTTVGDYTDIYRPIRWGGVVLERAWIEYSADPLLNIRAGHWLTPYGIWNVDHGSPVIIGVRRPYIVGEGLFPTSQTGLEFHGSHHVGSTRLGYHLTVSNGRGPLDTYQDLDYNKALGGRLYGAHEASWGNLTLGASIFRGRYTDLTEAFVVAADGSLGVERPITSEYKELSLAADLKFESKGFLLQSEGVVNDVAYKDANRPVALAFDGGPPGFAADVRRYGGYAFAGYRFDFLGTMPNAGFEFFKAPGAGLPDSQAVWAGLNLRPSPRVVLKAQYTYAWEPDAYPLYNSLSLQAAWSF